MNLALTEALRRLNLEARMRGYAVWGIWDDVVGNTVAQQAQPCFLRRGILFVKCSSPAWIQQLQFMKMMILKGLNQRLGREVIKEIRFQIGEVPRPSKDDQSDKEQKVFLDERTREQVEVALGPLKDTETKEIVRRILIREALLKRV
jgi:predicted nucleic acid-binding Zn ribbon protein